MQPGSARRLCPASNDQVRRTIATWDRADQPIHEQTSTNLMLRSWPCLLMMSAAMDNAI
jgi:hypothetical protein